MDKDVSKEHNKRNVFNYALHSSELHLVLHSSNYIYTCVSFFPLPLSLLTTVLLCSYTL